MTAYIGINHDIRNVNGSHIQMPPWCSGEPDKGWGNLELPNVYTLDTKQLYPHGTAFREGERTFFYAQYRGYIHTTYQEILTEAKPSEQANYSSEFGRGLLGYAFQQDYTASEIYGVAGEDKLYIKTATGHSFLTERANDFYAGGMYSVYNTATPIQTIQGGRVIKQVYSSTELTVGGNAISTPSILTTDQNLPVNVTWGTAIGTVMPNKWKLAVQGGLSSYNRYQPILGASCVGNITAANTWLWLQTYGEIMIAYASGALFGTTNDYQTAYWNADGSIDPGGLGTTVIRQLAGFLTGNKASESGTVQSESWPIVYLTMIK